MKIDVFAHVLLPQFYQKMLALDPALPQKMPFLQNPVLMDMEKRRLCKIQLSNRLFHLSMSIQKIILKQSQPWLW
ncbi:aminocarboxymuconate-semialdehyde decarboxylase [Streptococcus suis]|uniref:Aminocarboxymuconate-semialdehyde decarboxylase n=1 Tax=Streptococcus suis TaxID=1307 RepID=A0A0Z8GWJ2_STRSU|nr:aminocarboxymuconate-semialdehyde decarboxylase [Streptococcus suis]